MVATDPAVTLDVLRMECHVLRSDRDLVACLERDCADYAARKTAGTDDIAAGMRGYVFALADDGAAVEAALGADRRLLLAGRSNGWARGFYLLDTADLAVARTWFALASGGEVVLHPWYGSVNLAVREH